MTEKLFAVKLSNGDFSWGRGEHTPALFTRPKSAKDWITSWRREGLGKLFRNARVVPVEVREIT